MLTYKALFRNSITRGLRAVAMQFIELDMYHFCEIGKLLNFDFFISNMEVSIVSTSEGCYRD